MADLLRRPAARSGIRSAAPQPAAKAPPRNDELPLAQRLHHVQEELAQRWRRADRVLIECYLRDFPELRADDRAVLTLIVAEARLRLQRGEVLDMLAYRW